MSDPPSPLAGRTNAEGRSLARWLARLSILAAFLSCTLNCVFNQLASRADTWLGGAGWLIDWSSLAIVVTGAALGVVGLAGGLRRKSADTATIATIGLVLNLGILFVVIWYFAVVRPSAGGQ